MRIVIQRVKTASVTIGNRLFSEIGAGLLLLLAVEDADLDEDIEWLANKVVNLRIFDDEDGKMNISVLDAGGEMMVVSQFTLFASTKKGNRPSYSKSSKPETAIPIYEKFIRRLEEISGTKLKTGVFGAMMDISLVNDGPVTIIIDSKEKA